jgi:hypothetical protein
MNRVYQLQQNATLEGGQAVAIADGVCVSQTAWLHKSKEITYPSRDMHRLYVWLLLEGT